MDAKTTNKPNRHSQGRSYGPRQFRGPKPAVVITKEIRATMRSSCCQAGCVAGEKHEYGEQYCAKCKQACQWKVA